MKTSCCEPFEGLLAKRKLIAAFTVLGLACGGIAHPLDTAYLVGETDRNPLEYRAGEKMTFTLALVNADGPLEEGAYRIDWRRTGDDGLVTNGTVASVGFGFAAPLLPGYLTDASAGSESRDKGGWMP